MAMASRPLRPDMNMGFGDDSCPRPLALGNRWWRRTGLLDFGRSAERSYREIISSDSPSSRIPGEVRAIVAGHQPYPATRRNGGAAHPLSRPCERPPVNSRRGRVGWDQRSSERGLNDLRHRIRARACRARTRGLCCVKVRTWKETAGHPRNLTGMPSANMGSASMSSSCSILLDHSIVHALRMSVPVLRTQITQDLVTLPIPQLVRPPGARRRGSGACRSALIGLLTNRCSSPARSQCHWRSRTENIMRGTAVGFFPGSRSPNGRLAGIEIIPERAAALPGPCRSAIPVGVRAPKTVPRGLFGAVGFPEINRLLLRLAAKIAAATAFRTPGPATSTQRLKVSQDVLLETSVTERTAELRQTLLRGAAAERIRALLPGGSRRIIHSSDEHSRLYGFDPEPYLFSKICGGRSYQENRQGGPSVEKRGNQSSSKMQSRSSTPPAQYLHPVFTASGELHELMGGIPVV